MKEEWDLGERLSISGKRHQTLLFLYDQYLRVGGLQAISILNTLSAAARIPLGGILEKQTAIDLRRFKDQVTGWKKNNQHTRLSAGEA